MSRLNDLKIPLMTKARALNQNIYKMLQRISLCDMNRKIIHKKLEKIKVNYILVHLPNHI